MDLNARSKVYQYHIPMQSSPRSLASNPLFLGGLVCLTLVILGLVFNHILNNDSAGEVTSQVERPERESRAIAGKMRRASMRTARSENRPVKIARFQKKPIMLL